MYRFMLSIIVCATLLAPIAANAGQKPEQTANSSRLQAYTVLATANDASRLRREHYDISSIRGSSGNSIELEVIMTEAQAKTLTDQGLDVRLNTGEAAGPQVQLFGLAAEPVFRTYGGPDGLQQEMRDLAEQYPELTELEVIGQSGLGTDILALQVTNKSRHGLGHSKHGHGKKGHRKHGHSKHKHGKKPAVLYVSAQHAREWISPEVNRRLLHHFL